MYYFYLISASNASMASQCTWELNPESLIRPKKSCPTLLSQNLYPCKRLQSALNSFNWSGFPLGLRACAPDPWAGPSYTSSCSLRSCILITLRFQVKSLLQEMHTVTTLLTYLFAPFSALNITWKYTFIVIWLMSFSHTDWVNLEHGPHQYFSPYIPST